MIDPSQYDFGGRLRAEPAEPTSWEDLVRLSNEKLAFVYQRLSSHEQVKKHIWSQEAQDALIDLARQDGYPDDLIHVEQRDLGISGTKGREDRPGLAYLIQLVEAGQVEAVYVVHISRLYRDVTLINPLALGELFKEHGVIIVTPQMRLNLNEDMHMQLYRMEVQRAADELKVLAHRLIGARDLKARSGRYGGECLPPGYVLDTRKNLSSGDPNPDYHSYRIYEPHAEVVRAIFNRLAVPGMTPIRVARYCRRKGIAFSPFPPELDTPANLKSFTRSKRDVGGNWPITMERVKSIATNPTYLGWRLWSRQVVSKDAFPPIVDEATFWEVQERFSGGEGRPRKGLDPLPLAGLLYCGHHDVPRRMTYHNRDDGPNYQCIDQELQVSCNIVTARILDDPITEAVLSRVALPGGMVEKTLDVLTNEYKQAKEQAASYRREMRRLEAEVENLRGNLATGVLSANQVKWIDAQIQKRLVRIRELADLESRPIGQAVGRPVPGEYDRDQVRAFLENLGERWPECPNGQKNVFLRLLLDKIVVWPRPMEIRARLFWRRGLEQELVIYRPSTGRRRSWDDTELQTLREHYETAARDDLMAMLPGRTWKAITEQGKKQGLSRAHFAGLPVDGSAPRFTEEEDDLIRLYYNGEIGRDEVLKIGRTVKGIICRAARLGLERKKRIAWEWIEEKALIDDVSARRDLTPV